MLALTIGVSGEGQFLLWAILPLDLRHSFYLNYFESLIVMPSSDQIRAKLGLGPRPKPMFGHNRSHALNATRKISKPNLQNKWVVVDGQRYRIKLTAREMRTLDKKGISLLSG